MPMTRSAYSRSRRASSWASSASCCASSAASQPLVTGTAVSNSFQSERLASLGRLLHAGALVLGRVVGVAGDSTSGLPSRSGCCIERVGDVMTTTVLSAGTESWQTASVCGRQTSRESFQALRKRFWPLVSTVSRT